MRIFFGNSTSYPAGRYPFLLPSLPPSFPTSNLWQAPRYALLGPLRCPTQSIWLTFIMSVLNFQDQGILSSPNSFLPFKFYSILFIFHFIYLYIYIFYIYLFIYLFYLEVQFQWQTSGLTQAEEKTVSMHSRKPLLKEWNPTRYIPIKEKEVEEKWKTDEKREKRGEGQKGGGEGWLHNAIAEILLRVQCFLFNYIRLYFSSVSLLFFE